MIGVSVGDRKRTLWASVGTKPEKIPPSGWMGTQGSAKEEATTEWFLGKKVKSTVSPTAAVTMLGTKVNTPLSPTATE